MPYSNYKLIIKTLFTVQHIKFLERDNLSNQVEYYLQHINTFIKQQKAITQ